VPPTIPVVEAEEEAVPMAGTPYIARLMEELSAEIRKLSGASDDTAQEIVRLSERIKALEDERERMQIIYQLHFVSSFKALEDERERMLADIRHHCDRADHAEHKLDQIREVLKDGQPT